ncbi:MAG TPA: hypothetical protein VIX14_11355 [Terriglobales bacterium]
MTKRYYAWIVVPLLLSVFVLTLTFLRPGHVQAQAQPQFPIMDKIADKIVAQYRNSSCEELWQKKSQKAPPTPEEVRAVGILKSDPQMRTAFINRVAAPIANKMFDCGLIP